MMDFTGQVAIVTGAGRGLGRSHAMLLASKGCKVVINDLGGAFDGTGVGSRVADDVVREIKALGGEAVANYDSVLEGHKIVQTAIDTYGRVDILINNAGIAFPQALKNMKEEEWNRMLSIHLDGAFSVTKSCWPYFIKQKYGRVVMTSSPAGLYGTDGSVHYAVSKMGVVGFASSLQIEADRMKLDFRANCIAPQAATRMVADFGKAVANRRRRNKKTNSTTQKKNNSNEFTSNGFDVMSSPDMVSPVVVMMCSKECPYRSAVFEAGAGWYAQVRLQRSAGLFLNPKITGKMPTPEDILNNRRSTLDNFNDGDFPKMGDMMMGGSGFQKTLRYLKKNGGSSKL